MKFGVVRNISGNEEALADVDRQFDQLGVETRVCLGEIVGMYPYVDECVNLMIDRGYVALRTAADDGFVGYCDGTFDFAGWSTIHLVNALKFLRQRISEESVNYLRELPQRHVARSIAFEGLAEVWGGYLYDQDAVKAAFSAWSNDTVIHAAYLDPYVWREDLTGAFLSPGRTTLEMKGRMLISTGGLGSYYRGSTATKRPAAVVFDDQDRSVQVLRPMCAAQRIFEQLRLMGYPSSSLDYLERCEYREWL